MRSVRRLLIVAAAAALVLVLAGPAPAKERVGTAYVEGGRLTAEATESASSTAAVAAKGVADNCTWRTLHIDSEVYDEKGRRITSPTGRWLQKICDGSPVAVNGAFAVPARPPADPADVARQARASVAIADPSLSTSPSADRRLYVRVPTWLWLDPAWWQPYTATADTGGVSATVVATPVRATWTMGDGGAVTCSGPGVAWRRGLPDEATDCKYRYLHSSAGQPQGRFTMSVSVDFDVSWTSSTGAVGRLATVTRTASRSVDVGEIQAIETQ